MDAEQENKHKIYQLIKAQQSIAEIINRLQQENKIAVSSIEIDRLLERVTIQYVDIPFYSGSNKTSSGIDMDSCRT